MTRVMDLVPGDLVLLAGRSAVFVAKTNHPLYSTLDLVIWRVDDGSWSHDALLPHQYIGEATASDLQTRIGRLRDAFHGVPK